MTILSATATFNGDANARATLNALREELRMSQMWRVSATAQRDRAEHLFRTEMEAHQKTKKALEKLEQDLQRALGAARDAHMETTPTPLAARGHILPEMINMADLSVDQLRQIAAVLSL